MELPEGIIRTPEGWYVLEHDTHLSRSIEREGRLNLGQDDIDKCAPYIPVGATVIDAGAALGDHTIALANHVGPTGRVYAFEPHPRTFQALCLNMQAFPQVTAYQAALGWGGCEGLIHQSRNAGASFVTPNGMGGFSEGDAFDIPLPQAPAYILALDTFLLPKLTRCDFLHLDAEGTEPWILLGARKLLRKYRPLIVFEVSESHLKRQNMTPLGLMGILAALDYEVPLPDDKIVKDEANLVAWPVPLAPIAS
jgi:FkbM family methyltransferase